MNITESGKRLVESEQFALELREFVENLKAEGMPEDQGKATIISYVAWALAGRDVNHPPSSGEEALELGAFVREHASEIDAFVAKCLQTLVDNDCGSAVN
jgi:hypothetical protein